MHSKDGCIKHKRNLKHLAMPESKGALKKQKIGGVSKGHNLKALSMVKAGVIGGKNKYCGIGL